MNSKHSVFIKLTRTKVQQKITWNVEFISSCLICDNEEGIKNGSFSSIDSLLRHIRMKHNDHTVVKRYKLGLNHLQSVFDYWKPRMVRLSGY